MFAETRFRTQSEVRPPPDKERELVLAVSNARRDLQEILHRDSSSSIHRLAFEGLDQILQLGSFRRGHSQQTFAIMDCRPPWTGRTVTVHLGVDIETAKIGILSLDFYYPRDQFPNDWCAFRCNVHIDPEKIAAQKAYLGAVKSIMLSREEGLDDPKWNSFGGLQSTGPYSEAPLMVTAISHENYERMKHLGIASKDPADLADLVVKEIGLPPFA